MFVESKNKQKMIWINSFLILVKPIINILINEKEFKTKTLTVIENTFKNIRCIISSNPSIISPIEWFKNDQLIFGMIIQLSRIYLVR
jgi:hypothetical protein